MVPSVIDCDRVSFSGKNMGYNDYPKILLIKPVKINLEIENLTISYSEH